MQVIQMLRVQMLQLNDPACHKAQHSQINMYFLKKGYLLSTRDGSLLAQMVTNRLQCGRPAFDSWVGKIPWRRAWQYSCLEYPHGQRSLVGYSPRGRKELDTTERLSTAEMSNVLFFNTICFSPPLSFSSTIHFSLPLFQSNTNHDRACHCLTSIQVFSHRQPTTLT